MTSNDEDELRQLISSKPGIVEFGTSADAVEPEWFDKAEAVLGRPLPESYKWFLKNYAGGEIGGEEIYSLYGMDFDSVNGGDIVFQHLANRKAGLLDESKVVVSETDLGEVFYFDYEHLQGGECPIYQRLPSGHSVKYANDFFEFLKKRIEAHS